MKRIAIFGSQGQLGVELAGVFGESCEVAAYDRDCVDITDAAAVEKAIAAYEPSLVLNAAAYNGVDAAEDEPDKALAVNALAVRNLAISCRGVQAKLVHYSTDYVFDGAAGDPYTEDAPTHPIGAYAVSKLAGEMYAQAYLDNALIIRTCSVFGPRAKNSNFMENILRQAERGEEVRGVDDQIASPAYAPALAGRTADLVQLDARGVFHIGGGQAVSRYDWAVMILEAAGYGSKVKRVSSSAFRVKARRPAYSVLSNKRMESLGVAPMPHLEAAVQDYLAKRAKSVAN